MQIMEIDPNKKYILVLPKMDKKEAMALARAIEDFPKDKMHHFAFVYGEGVAILPLESVVGYIPFARMVNNKEADK